MPCGQAFESSYYVPLVAGNGDEERDGRSLSAVFCECTHLVGASAPVGEGVRDSGASAPVGEGVRDSCTPYKNHGLSLYRRASGEDEKRNRRSLSAMLRGCPHLVGASTPAFEEARDRCTPYKYRSL